MAQKVTNTNRLHVGFIVVLVIVFSWGGFQFYVDRYLCIIRLGLNIIYVLTNHEERSLGLKHRGQRCNPVKVCSQRLHSRPSIDRLYLERFDLW